MQSHNAKAALDEEKRLKTEAVMLKQLDHAKGSVEAFDRTPEQQRDLTLRNAESYHQTLAKGEAEEAKKNLNYSYPANGSSLLSDPSEIPRYH